MKKRLRIAIGRINQETNALSPVRTTLADFERTHLRAGAELLASLHPLRSEVPGMFRNVELSGFARRARAYRHADVELVPLLSAWAVASGPLERACFDALVARTTDALRAA